MIRLGSHRLILALSFLMVTACGAPDKEPAPQEAPSAHCPTLRELAPKTFAAIEGGEVPAIQRLIGEQISDTHLTALVNAAISLVRSLQETDLSALSALRENADVEKLTDGAVRLIRFLAGTDESPFRAEVFTDLHRLVTHCRATPMLIAIEEAVYTPELPELFDQLNEVLALEPVQQVLAADGAFAKEGFTAFICNMMSNLIQPDFSVSNDVVQPLARLDILPLDEPPLSGFMRNLNTILGADRPLKPAMANLVCCDLYNLAACDQVTGNTELVSRDPVYSWLMYDLFIRRDELFAPLFSALSDLLANPDVAATGAPIWNAISTLAKDTQIGDAANSVLRIILNPDVAEPLLSEVAMLLELGVVTEITEMASAIQRGCVPEEMTE